jgi:hypothetical protein
VNQLVAGVLPLHGKDDLEHEVIVRYRHPGSVAGGAMLKHQMRLSNCQILPLGRSYSP